MRSRLRFGRTPGRGPSSAGAATGAGGAAARIATLEQRVGEQRLVAERLARLETQGEATAAAV